MVYIQLKTYFIFFQIIFIVILIMTYSKLEYIKPILDLEYNFTSGLNLEILKQFSRKFYD